MKVKILGCSGGIGAGPQAVLRTIAMLVDDDILIDAGTGVGELTMSQLLTIDHIFITHSHLDHITSIPFLLDSVMGQRALPVTLHGVAETLQILKDHIFNWKIWPDFSVIPDTKLPLLQYNEIKVGESIVIAGRRVTALPANHAVPAVGYQLDSGKHSLVFSGDTTTCDAFWPLVNAIGNLKYLVIETSYSNAEIAVAKVARHMCPSLLLEGLARLKHPAEVYITHLKPGWEDIILHEIAQGFAQNPALALLYVPPRVLQNAQIFEL
jgi:ribonuclease BN (tRNA processing enzyme)